MPSWSLSFLGEISTSSSLHRNDHPQVQDIGDRFLGDSGSGGAQQLQPYPLRVLSAFPRVLWILELLPQLSWRVHPTQTGTGSKSTRAAPLPLEMGTDWVQDSKIYCSVNSRERTLGKKPLAEYLDLPLSISLQSI